jgi:secreted trypsin-like serine protease
MRGLAGLGAIRLGRGGARYVLVVVFGLMLGLSVAAPVFAADGGIRPQVVGGAPVPNGDYPFVASLGDARHGATAYRRHYCGGSLIDRNSVLTAAHCVRGTPRRPLRVVVGRTVLSGGGGQARRVARIAIHPRFDGFPTLRYDAAVLTLRSPVRGIAPIGLSGAAQNPLERPGRLATIAGWGNTIKQPPRGTNGGSYPDRMRVARVPIVSDATARRAYGPVYVGALMVAAGKKGKDACYGDSGGPVFARRAGKRYQIGITSFGKGCATRRYPGAYTEVNARPIRRFIVKAAGLN